MKTPVLLVIVNTLLLLASFSSSASEIYKWVGENGKVHFGDRKLNSVNQQTVELDIALSEWQRFDIQVESRGAVLTEKEHNDIVDGVNNVYEFYDRVMYFDIYKTVPVKILVLKDKAMYNSFLSKRTGKQRHASLGVYFPYDNQIVVYMREDREKTFKTIKHEVSHAIVDTITSYTPIWLNEGLAEQMETIEKSEEGLYVKAHVGNRYYVDKAYKDNKLMDIETFLKLPTDQWRKELNARNYPMQVHAGQLVYFLLSTSPSRSFIVRILHEFERGNQTLSYYLVDDNYIGGIETLKRNWLNWLKGQNKPLIQF